MRGQRYTMRHSIPEAQNGQQQQPNTAIGPCVTEMNTQCLEGANLEMGGEEKDLCRMPATTEVQQRGVSKRHEESHSRVDTVHCLRFWTALQGRRSFLLCLLPFSMAFYQH